MHFSAQRIGIGMFCCISGDTRIFSRRLVDRIRHQGYLDGLQAYLLLCKKLCYCCQHSREWGNGLDYSFRVVQKLIRNCTNTQIGYSNGSLVCKHDVLHGTDMGAPLGKLQSREWKLEHKKNRTKLLQTDQCLNRYFQGAGRNATFVPAATAIINLHY